MNKKILSVFILLLLIVSLSACKAFNKTEARWSQWFDQGDETHARYSLDNIDKREIEPHTYDINQVVVEATETKEGKIEHKCSKCGHSYVEELPMTGGAIFDQEVVDDKYLYLKINEYTSYYYKSSKDGKFGNPRYIFKHTIIPAGFESVSSIIADGRQYIETDYSKDSDNYIQYNGKDGFQRTPNEYVRLDYITTGLNQTLTIDYIPKIDDSIEVTFELLSVKEWTPLFSSRIAPYTEALSFFVQDGGNKGRFELNNEYIDFDYEFKLNHKYTVKVENGNSYIDDELVATIDPQDFEPSNQLSICSCKQDGVYNHTSNLKIHEYVIRNKYGELIHHLIPMYSLEECVAGLYDIIDNRFYRSESIDYIYDSSVVERTMSIEQFYISESLERAKYIENNDGLYIDTGVVPTSKTEVEITFKANSINDEGPYIFGAGGSSFDDNAFELYPCNGNFEFNFGDQKFEVKASTGITTFSFKGGIASFADSSEYMKFTNTTEPTKTLTVFALNRTTGILSSGSSQIYSFKIWENGMLIRNYIPIYNRELNKYGLYDLVSRREFYPEIGFLTGERYNYYGQYLEFTGKTEKINTYVSEDLELAQYIESNGNQQIKTGLIFNPETDSIVCDFESTIANQNGMIIGSAQGDNYFWFYHYSSGAQIAVYSAVDGSQLKVGGRPTDLSRHSMSYTNKTFYIDGTLLGADTRTLKQCDEELYISSWGNNYFYSGRIYSIKIYRGQYLIRNYIPIYNKKLNKYGLYDRVEEKEYYSDTNSPYSGKRYGTSTDYSMYELSVIINKIKEAGLDQVYDLAEYIESTGTQYIDTGYVIKPNTSIESEIMFTDQFSYNMMYGAWPLFSIALVNENVLCVGGGSTETQNIGINIQKNTKYKILHSPQGIMLNGVSKPLGNGVNSNPNERTLLLFAASDSSTNNIPYVWQSYGKGRIYGLKVYEGTELVHFFIPIYNKVTNQYGMFDAFTNKDFYSLSEENFNGKISSNSFINQSTDVPSYLTLAEYIESDGKEYIDTNYKVSSEKLVLDFMIGLKDDTGTLSMFGSLADKEADRYDIVPYHNDSFESGVYSHLIGNSDAILEVKYNTGVNDVKYILNDGKVICRINGKTYSGTYEGSIISDNNFYIIGYNAIDSVHQSSSGYKIYYYKIYDNEVLVRYMIPVYNNQTNKYGMYDFVEGKEYYSPTDDLFKGKISEQSSSSTTINIPGYLSLADHVTFTGAQCIDSEIKQLTAYNFTISIDYKRSDIDDADSCLMGQRQFGKFTNIYRGYFESAYGNTANSTAKDTDRHTIIMDNAGLYLDGKTLISKSLSLVQSEYSALIGAYSEDDYTNAKWFFKGDIYGIKILDSGNCIRSFIPIYNTLTSNYGLYDLVERKEYYSVTETKLKGTLANTSGSILPNYLEEAEYIQSTGTQYIDTGFSTITGMRCKYKANWQTGGYVCGSHSLNDPYGRNSGYLTAYGSWALGYGNIYPEASNSCELNTDYEVEFKTTYDEAFLKVNGDTIITSKGQTTSGNNVLMFACGYYSPLELSAGKTTQAKLYYCKIWNSNDVLVRDFIPVHNKLTNNYGLYDMVEGKEYYSESEDGFLGSASEQIKLPSHLSHAEYIESMGGEYILLPNKLNCDYFEIEAQYKEAEQEGALIGNYSDGTSQRWELFTYPQSKTYNIWSANVSTLTSSVDATLKAKISYSYKTGKIRINDKEYNFGKLECQPSHLLQYGNDTLYAKARIYYVKFAKDGETILHLIPIFNTDTNRYGLYDLISGGEYYSPSKSSFAGALKDNSSLNIDLPDYIESADYVKFTGSQTVNSLVTGGGTWTFDLKWIPGNDRELMGYGGSASEYFGIGKDGKYGIFSSGSVMAGNRDLVEFRYDEGESGIWVNGKKIFGTDYDENKTNKPFTFGSIHGGFFATNLTIYDITCVQNEKTVKHFIPIYNKITNEYGLYDLVEGQEYYSTTETPLTGARNSSGSVKVSSDMEALFVYKGETFKSKCSGVIIYDKEGNVLSNYAPVKRLSDGKVGFIDLITNEFYLDQNGESFKYETVTLPIESETVIKEPTYNEDGIKEIKYVGVDEKELVKIDKLSYLVTFTHSNRFAIRIYYTTNIKDGFIDSDSTYSKNQYTFNYSKVNAFVMFEVISYYGDAYKIGGRATNVKDNIYIIYNIDSDMFISIIE